MSTNRTHVLASIITRMFYLKFYSHPIPSLSPSNPCGSAPVTRNFLCGKTSLQSRSGGGDAMQRSGYDGSQLVFGRGVIFGLKSAD